jgi:hypothetical protein
MKGYIRFDMVIWLERKNQKITRQIQEVLDRHFVIALPTMHQEDVINYQLVVSSIFEIDPSLKEIESLDGVG